MVGVGDAAAEKRVVGWFVKKELLGLGLLGIDGARRWAFQGIFTTATAVAIADAGEATVGAGRLELTALVGIKAED